MRLDRPWLHRPAVIAVLDALERGGARAWFVGGCVRDGLLGLEAGDIDIATDAVPDRVTELVEGRAARGADRRGARDDHGRVGPLPVEVTTLRRDVATDGRRATVAFTDRLEEDAGRRDFTVNALYATRDGAVLDPVGEGLGDLRARRIRFIGDPHDRIREDYLRILRFFRFHAWYADPGPWAWMPTALAASAELADGIDRLAKERIGMEMRKLLAAPDPAPAVAAMAQAGILHRILPGADARSCRCWWPIEDEATCRPTAAAAGRCSAGRMSATRCACRGPRRRCWRACATGMAGRCFGAVNWAIGTGRGWRGISCCCAARWRSRTVDATAEVASWRRARGRCFPVKAADLMPRGQGSRAGRGTRTAGTTLDRKRVPRRRMSCWADPDPLDSGPGRGLGAPLSCGRG
jgi:poly(A) polymerase